MILLLGPVPSAFAQTDLVGRRISERDAEDLFRPKLKIGNDAGAIAQVSAGPAQGLFTLVMEDGTVRLWDLGVGAQLAITSGACSEDSLIRFHARPRLIPYAARE